MSDGNETPFPPSGGQAVQPDILAAIFGERIEQRRLFSAAHDDLHNPWEWLGLLTRHAGLAVDDGGAPAHLSGYDEARFEKQMIRVAALAVAAIESRRRLAARARQAGTPSEGSGF